MFDPEVFLGDETGRDAVGRPMEILLVEDSLLEARLTMGALRNGRVDHRMTWLRNGTEAMAFLKQFGRFKNAPHPDLVLLDLRLPGLDGIDLLEQARADDALSGVPFVVMTGSTDDEDLRRAKAVGIEAYMTKPVDLEKFLTVVADLKRFWKDDMVIPEALAS